MACALTTGSDHRHACRHNLRQILVRTDRLERLAVDLLHLQGLAYQQR